jgi:hypothetical protein
MAAGLTHRVWMMQEVMTALSAFHLDTSMKCTTWTNEVRYIGLVRLSPVNSCRQCSKCAAAICIASITAMPCRTASLRPMSKIRSRSPKHFASLRYAL